MPGPDIGLRQDSGFVKSFQESCIDFCVKGGVEFVKNALESGNIGSIAGKFFHIKLALLVVTQFLLECIDELAKLRYG